MFALRWQPLAQLRDEGLARIQLLLGKARPDADRDPGAAAQSLAGHAVFVLCGDGKRFGLGRGREQNVVAVFSG